MARGNAAMEEKKDRSSIIFTYGKISNFLALLNEVISDPNSNNCIRWLSCGTRFVISNKLTFAKEILPRFGLEEMRTFYAKLKKHGYNQEPHINDAGAYHCPNFTRTLLNLDGLIRESTEGGIPGLGIKRKMTMLALLHEVVSDHESDASIHWLPCGTRFTISDEINFAKNILPRFGNGNLATFIWRLRRYGFNRLTSRDFCVFHNPNFAATDDNVLEEAGTLLTFADAPSNDKNARINCSRRNPTFRPAGTLVPECAGWESGRQLPIVSATNKGMAQRCQWTCLPNLLAKLWRSGRKQSRVMHCNLWLHRSYKCRHR